ncbi:hypothetical protein GCM10011425_14140 [Mucilaginibacter galii]|uniref:Uncharacterized protein n=1 Tax=Mucilaginibacter galii TaxID=2005073 RepID=A0A917J8Q7_9SPHI|nr:hypothetical protein GCM10011425_14140 [Mucilaginibacter galii]
MGSTNGANIEMHYVSYKQVAPEGAFYHLIYATTYKTQKKRLISNTTHSVNSENSGSRQFCVRDSNGKPGVQRSERGLAVYSPGRRQRPGESQKYRIQITE